LSVTDPENSEEPKGIDETGLGLGFTNDKWKTKNSTGTPSDYIKIYSKNSNIFFTKAKTLNLREFTFFEITYFVKKITNI
jgi:hypothetical protein